VAHISVLLARCSITVIMLLLTTNSFTSKSKVIIKIKSDIQRQSRNVEQLKEYKSNKRIIGYEKLQISRISNTKRERKME
jgi:hypothetical protein